MTAVNCAVQGKRAYLYADTAYTRESGELEFCSSKILIGRNFPWAMAVSGFGSAFPRLCEAINEALPRNVSGFVRALPSILQRALDLSADDPTCTRSLGLTLAVYDARLQRARCFMIDNDGSVLNGLGAPFEAVEVDWMAYSRDGLDAEALLGRPVDMTDPRSFDPDTDGLALMEGQRQLFRWGPNSTSPKCCRIGGGLEQAIVTKRSVQLYALHDWGDRVGEQIGPEEAEHSDIPLALIPAEGHA